MFIQFLFIIWLDDIKNLDNHVHLKYHSNVCSRLNCKDLSVW